MIISDEQYEEMNNRIDDLTYALAYLVNGKIIIINKKDYEMFVKIFAKSEYNLFFNVSEDGNLVWRIMRNDQQ